MHLADLLLIELVYNNQLVFLFTSSQDVSSCSYFLWSCQWVNWGKMVHTGNHSLHKCQVVYYFIFISFFSTHALAKDRRKKNVLSLDERLERFMFQTHAWRRGWNVWSSDSKRQDFGVFVLFVAPRCRGNSLENGNTSCLVPATGLETQLASLTDGLWAWTGCSKSRGKKNLGSFTAPNSAFNTAPPLKRFFRRHFAHRYSVKDRALLSLAWG